ncbi:MAG: phosphatidylserine decarboxylase [Thermodesulfobacteriota bacterium]
MSSLPAKISNHERAEMQHQFVERETGKTCTEPLFWDRTIRMLYSHARERLPSLFLALTGARTSSLLSRLAFDGPFTPSMRSIMTRSGAGLSECVADPSQLRTARSFFERRIRYWECRPMPDDPHAVVSPADAKVVLGSLAEYSALFVKGKFFDLEELLGRDKALWVEAFRDGDFAVFRLTPEKYHYNHTPVAGRVLDFYCVTGRYHSCNPSAVVELAAPYSKNKRVVTIVDTDVSGGSKVGIVAMIEVVALMIGDVVQCYSDERYEHPQRISPGMFLRRGVPKSLYRPGSSTNVLLFGRGRVRFAEDLLANLHRTEVQSRFSCGFGQPLVETDLKVRSLIATASS